MQRTTSCIDDGWQDIPRCILTRLQLLMRKHSFGSATIFRLNTGQKFGVPPEVLDLLPRIRLGTHANRTVFTYWCCAPRRILQSPGSRSTHYQWHTYRRLPGGFVCREEIIRKT